MTGDEARAALDSRLLDICREWLSIVEETDWQRGNPMDRIRAAGNRLMRKAYDAGIERGARSVASWLSHEPRCNAVLISGEAVKVK